MTPLPHQALREKKCQICTKVLPLRNKLDKVMYPPTKEMLFLCDGCSGVDSSTNTDGKKMNFSCGVCSERFSEQWDLHVHLRTQHFVQVKNLTFVQGNLKMFGKEEEESK